MDCSDKHIVICPDTNCIIGDEFDRTGEAVPYVIFIDDDDVIELGMTDDARFHVPGIYEWWKEFDSYIISYADSTVVENADWASWINRGIWLAHHLRQILPLDIEVIFRTPYEVPKQFKLPDISIVPLRT